MNPTHELKDDGWHYVQAYRDRDAKGRFQPAWRCIHQLICDLREAITRHFFAIWSNLANAAQAPAVRQALAIEEAVAAPSEGRIRPGPTPAEAASLDRVRLWNQPMRWAS